MENKESYKEERFDSYINKIIIFSSKGYFKKQMSIVNKERMVIDNEEDASYIEGLLASSTSYSTTDDIDNRIELNSALNSLSAIEQAVIFLLFKEELNQDEASKILEICSKSVSRIKIRAINKLKKYLKGDF